jgi:hypothetical protein
MNMGGETGIFARTLGNLQRSTQHVLVKARVMHCGNMFIPTIQMQFEGVEI